MLRQGFPRVFCSLGQVSKTFARSRAGIPVPSFSKFSTSRTSDHPSTSGVLFVSRVGLSLIQKEPPIALGEFLQARSFSTNTGPRVENTGPDVDVAAKAKPLPQWTKQDVDKWLQTNEDFKVLSDNGIMKRYAGNDLLNLSKEDVRVLIRDSITLGRLSPDEYDLVEPLFNAIQALKNPPVDDDPAKLMAPVPDKTASDWDHLRDLDSLREKVGTMIRLPRLPLLPKEMEEDRLEEYLLTKQRFQLAEEFWKKCRFGEMGENPREQQGFILSGPNGVGKTAVSYLLACISWVKSTDEQPVLLLYSPLTASWIEEKTIEERAQYILKRFTDLNAIPAARIKVLSTNLRMMSLLDIALEGTSDRKEAVRAFTSLLEGLGTLVDVPVVYIIDEHNEIYKNDMQKEVLFAPFTKFTGKTSGKRVFTVLSGSAHSQFEKSLQPGFDTWLRRIVPFDKQSFDTLVKALLAKEKEDSPGLSRVPVDGLYEITGGCPGELHKLAQFLRKSPSVGVADWVLDREMAMFEEAAKYWNKLNAREQTDFMRFLDSMFSPRKYDETTESPPGLAYDAGLIYRDGIVYRPTCLPAKMAWQRHYFSLLGEFQKNLARGTEAGLLFEKRVIAKVYTGLQFEEGAKVFRLGTLHDGLKGSSNGLKFTQQDPPVFIPEARDVQKFGVEQKFALDLKKPRLFIPVDPNFPAWDLIVYDSTKPRFVFIQTSIQMFRAGEYDKKISGSFKTKTRTDKKTGKSVTDPPLVQKVLEMITGKPATVGLTEDGGFHAEIDGLPSAEFEWLFVTTQSYADLVAAEQNLRNDRKEDKTNCPDVLVVPREACVQARIIDQ